jgi:spore coat polysaccharide biosynthesis protein SpsF
MVVLLRVFDHVRDAKSLAALASAFVVAMRTVAIIEARMGSTRLPGKVMMDLGGEPMLSRMIDRVRRCRNLDDVLVATTTSPGDDPIVDMAVAKGVGYCRGSEEDVLGRVLDTADRYGVDVIVELTADCPLIDPRIIDETVAAFHDRQPDFCWNPNHPVGMSTRVFRRGGLSLVGMLTDDPTDREHVSCYFWTHPGEFEIVTVQADPIHQDEIELTVDTQDDLDLIRMIFSELYSRSPHFGLPEILLLLHQHPELREINRHVRRTPTPREKGPVDEATIQGDRDSARAVRGAQGPPDRRRVHSEPG